MARLQSAFAKSAALCTRATIPRPASSATIVASGGPFLGSNAITEVDVSSAWTRIIAPFPQTQPCQYRQHDAGPFLAGSRLINQGDPPPHSWRQHPLDPCGVAAFSPPNEGGGGGWGLGTSRV